MMRMHNKTFIDTNILIYLYSSDEPDKRTRAYGIFQDSMKPLVSVHVFNELCNVFIKKFKIGYETILLIIHEISNKTTCVKTSLNTTKKAIELNHRYGFSFFDSFHLATALESRCSVFFSEDMRHGQTIESVRIVNPFFD